MAFVTETAIRKWHRDAGEYIRKIPGCSDILRQPARHFNADETGFALDAGTGRIINVIAPRGSRCVAARSAGTKQQVTAMMCACATGEFIPPFIILPGKRTTMTPNQCDMSSYKEAYYVTSNDGWQTADTFLLFVQQFYAWVCRRQIQFPVVLWVDGHRSHVSEEVATWAREHRIVIYLLNPNSTNLLQPFDVAIAASLKAAWGAAVHAYQRKEGNVVVSKYNFPGVLKAAVEKACTKEAAIKGFRKCGLQPFNADGWTSLPRREKRKRKKSDS